MFGICWFVPIYEQERREEKRTETIKGETPKDKDTAEVKKSYYCLGTATISISILPQIEQLRGNLNAFSTVRTI